MALITFFEPNWERTVRGAYAEKKDNAYVSAKVEEIRLLIANNHYLYRCEDTSSGAFVGFVIYQGNGVPTYNYNGDMIPVTGNLRPQFDVMPINTEYNLILTTTVNNNL